MRTFSSSGRLRPRSRPFDELVERNRGHRHAGTPPRAPSSTDTREIVALSAASMIVTKS